MGIRLLKTGLAVVLITVACEAVAVAAAGEAAAARWLQND